jgi:hypothetical protein
MPAPTPRSRPLHIPAGPVRDAEHRLILPGRSTLGAAFDAVARVGTAVTLVALLVVTCAVLGVDDDSPVRAGPTTAGR